jgi:hypothetical protein|nr:MAG TPA: hypothetical protein [Caudoviricetes sp.]
MVQTLKTLKRLKAEKKITLQQYRTYRGQVFSGNIDGCIVGLKRKKLI